jgi:hypothetical protein
MQIKRKEDNKLLENAAAPFYVDQNINLASIFPKLSRHLIVTVELERNVQDNMAYLRNH